MENDERDQFSPNILKGLAGGKRTSPEIVSGFDEEESVAAIIRSVSRLKALGLVEECGEEFDPQTNKVRRLFRLTQQGAVHARGAGLITEGELLHVIHTLDQEPLQ